MSCLVLRSGRASRSWPSADYRRGLREQSRFGLAEDAAIDQAPELGGDALGVLGQGRGRVAGHPGASVAGAPPQGKCGEADAGLSPGSRVRWPASWRAISSTCAPTERRRCATCSAQGRDGHIASWPPAASSRSARAFSTGISAGGTRWLKVVSLSSYDPRIATGPLVGCGAVQESSIGTKGSGCSRYVRAIGEAAFAVAAWSEVAPDPRGRRQRDQVSGRRCARRHSCSDVTVAGVCPGSTGTDAPTVGSSSL